MKSVMTHSTCLVIAAAGFMCFGGCRNVNTVESYNSGDKLSQVDRVENVDNDRSLRGKAQVTEVRRTVTGSNVLKIQARIENSTNRRQRVRYKIEWMDDNRMLLDTSHDDIWHALDLNGKEVRMVTAVAPTPKATNYKITLKESDR